MPEAVTICEMSPRDGMQVLNRSRRIPLEMRIALVRALQHAGIAYIEAGSFVSEKAFPQFADTAQLLAQIDPPAGDQQIAVLVPNLRYYEKFKGTPNLTTVAMVLSASETYSQKNKRMTVDEDLAESKRLAGAAREHGHRLRAHVSAAFRDLPPREGPADLDTVTRLASDLMDAGCETVALADTDGQATPMDIARTIEHVKSRVDLARLGVHLHDRFGLAIVNAWEAYRLGIRTFDGAVGGIGGNKAVAQSIGNVATEDLVRLFEHLGVETGIDRQGLAEAVQIVHEMTQLVGDPPPRSLMRDDFE